MNDYQYHGQFNQDKWLHENIFFNKRNGVFVEIGAADPIKGSNSFFFENTLGWNGYCIEARGSACELLKKTRTSTIINATVGDTTRRSIFLECGVFSGLIRNFSEREFDNLEKFHPNKKTVDAYWIDCIMLKDIFEKYSINKIDLLMIDTEGAELPILSTIQNQLNFIDVVMTESNNRERRIDVRDFMLSNNFEFIIGLGMDDVYINKNVRATYSVNSARF